MSNDLPDRTGWLEWPVSAYPPVPPFPAFTAFEQSVLGCIADHTPDGSILRRQLSAAKVVDRVNTSVGFYTRIVVDQSKAPPLARISRQQSGAITEILQARHGLVFHVGYVNGYLDEIEGILNGSKCDGDSLDGLELRELQLTAVLFDDGLRIEIG